MSLTEFLLSLVLQYTPVAVPISMSIGGLGVPMPNSMITIVLGTLVQQKLLAADRLFWYVYIPTLVGDIGNFILARKVVQSKTWARGMRYIPFARSETDQTKATRFFNRFGSWSIFLSRFIITPLAVPINFLAASHNYPVRTFIAIAAIGEVLWVLLYATVGYYFGLYWQTVYQILNNLIGMLSMLALIVLLLTIRSSRRRKTKLTNEAAGLEAPLAS